MGFIRGVWRLMGADDEDGIADRDVRATSSRGYPIVDESALPAVRDEPQDGIISMPAGEGSTIFIAHPGIGDSGKVDFSLKTYASYLLTRQALVLDVNDLAAADLGEATRVVDYLSGVVEAVDGIVWEVANNIFIFAPRNVNLAGDPIKQVEVY
ncbi:cell division protein SepF [bacterium]|nr:cell division protein SepF [bacterium]